MIFNSVDDIITAFRQVVKEELALANEKKKEKLYTVEETCEIFNISVGTLHNWRNAGKIKSVKVGHRPLFPQDEIDRVKIVNKR
jgi:excisionase family DNA binding protein